MSTNNANINQQKNEQKPSASKNKRGATPSSSRHTVIPHLFFPNSQAKFIIPKKRVRVSLKVYLSKYYFGFLD